MALDLKVPILVVDDSSTMTQIIRSLLHRIGFNDIDAAKDGDAALKQLRCKKYGLVISDWNMEPMSGLDLLRRVRTDRVLESIPFIMVTAESKIDNVIAAKDAGVSDYIVKPFTAQTLRSKIETIFAEKLPLAPVASA